MTKSSQNLLKGDTKQIPVRFESVSFSVEILSNKPVLVPELKSSEMSVHLHVEVVNEFIPDGGHLKMVRLKTPSLISLACSAIF